MKYDLGSRRYDEIEDKANNLILSLDSILPPYNLEKLAESLGIKVIRLSSLTGENYKPFAKYFLCEENDAFVCRNEDFVKMIVDDILRPSTRIYFTIAHEIGHVVLGHLEHSPLAEFEANIFARCLVTPHGIIRSFSEDEFTVDYISDFFCVSKEAARHCRDRSLNRMHWHNDDNPESTLILFEKYSKLKKGGVM